MKKIIISFFTVAFTFLASGNMALAKLKPVKVEELYRSGISWRMDNPWELSLADNMLGNWKEMGKRIHSKVNPETGVKK